MHLGNWKMEWGLLAVINLYECDESSIRNEEKIREFIEKLCEKIGMHKYGEALIKRFGKDNLEGYSAIQFIETSTITIHFDETKNRAFIDIFSCKKFDEKTAEAFSKKFFNAKSSVLRIFARN